MLVKPLTLALVLGLLLAQPLTAADATQSLTAVRRAAEGQLRRELDR